MHGYEAAMALACYSCLVASGLLSHRHGQGEWARRRACAHTHEALLRGQPAGQVWDCQL